VYLIALTHFGLRESFTVISGGREPMKRVKLWSLVAGLAVGNFMGCSRASTKSPDTSYGIRAGPEVAEGRQEVAPGMIQAKPSACIKWDKGSGRLSKPLRKAKDAIVSKDPEKKLQAKNENQPH
jgi:hypothetical protein